MSSSYASLQARGRELDNLLKFKESKEFKHLLDSQVITPKDVNLGQMADYLNEQSED